MKKKSGAPASSSSSPWSNHADQFQWLHSNSSELEKKIEMILSIIEEDDEGSRFAESSRVKLVEMIKEVHLSYRHLADRYEHQLRSQSNLRLNNVVHDVDKSSKFVVNSKLEEQDEEEDILAAKPNSVSLLSVGPDEEDEDIKDVEINNCNNNGTEEEEEDDDDDEVRMINVWSRVVEENIRQQAELIKRNNDKREEIKDLWIQIGKLTRENKALKISLGHCNFDLMKMMTLINKSSNKSPSRTTTSVEVHQMWFLRYSFCSIFFQLRCINALSLSS